MPVPTPLLLAHGWGSLTWGLGHTAQLSAPMQVMGGFGGVTKGWGQLWDLGGLHPSCALGLSRCGAATP